MDFKKVPKASEVIKHLELLISEHGDLPVCANDADTSWRLRIGITFKPKNNDRPSLFEINSEYHCMPDGLIGMPDEV